MKTVQIGDFTIENEGQPFIIAEVGINHNGDVERAFEMIRVAKQCGADAVKFQTFKAEEFVSDPEQTYTYTSQGQQVTESMLAMFQRYEFSPDVWKDIKRRCQEEGIVFFSTPQNRSDLDVLLDVGVPAVKVGSDDFTNLPLLQSYSESGIPLILSCGMSDLSEVYQALDAVGALDGYPTILLLCVSQYPTPPKDVNLRRIRTLQAAFPMIPIGFSDHTQGPLASSLAVSFGACCFEKHFTLSHDDPGPDHWFSEDPAGLKEWVESIRTAYTIMGSSLVRATSAEEEMKVLARRSIVALKDIEVGDVLNETNVGLKRPGNGLPPALLPQVWGLKASQKIVKGSLLTLGSFA